MPVAEDALKSNPPATFPSGGPGLYAGVPSEAYHAYDACSSSRLTLLKRSPAHAKEAIESGPEPSTKAQRLGTAAHALLLEPERAEDVLAVKRSCSATTNAGDPCSNTGKVRRGGQWYCGIHDPGTVAGDAFDGVVVSESEETSLRAMRDAVRVHSAAAEALSGGEAELTALFEHEDLNRETGEVRSTLSCKARIDYYDPSGKGTLADLKTTRDASAEEFQKTLYRSGYHRQLAFYRYALRQCGQHVGRALIVAVEKEAPFAVAVYELTETTLKAGKRDLDNLIARYAECERSGAWPAYPEDVQKLELPHWAWD